MNYRLARILFIAALLIVVLTLSLPFFFDNPKDTHNLSSAEFIVRKSGLAPKFHLPLKFATTTLYILFVISYLYADKLVKRPETACTITGFRRSIFVMYYSLLSASLLMIIQLVFCIMALARIPSLQPADIIYSAIPVYSACLCCAFGFLPFSHKQVKFYRTNSLPDILSRLTSDQPTERQAEDCSHV